MGMKAKPSRRAVLGAGTGAALLGGPSLSTAAPVPESPRIYTRIGVKPFINLTATYTINGGLVHLKTIAWP